MNYKLVNTISSHKMTYIIPEDCENPEEIIEFMDDFDQDWLGFHIIETKEISHQEIKNIISEKYPKWSDELIEKYIKNVSSTHE